MCVCAIMGACMCVGGGGGGGDIYTLRSPRLAATSIVGIPVYQAALRFRFITTSRLKGSRIPRLHAVVVDTSAPWPQMDLYFGEGRGSTQYTAVDLHAWLA